MKSLTQASDFLVNEAVDTCVPDNANVNLKATTQLSQSPPKAETPDKSSEASTEPTSAPNALNEDGEAFIECERTFYEHFRDESILLRRQLRHELAMIFMKKKKSSRTLFTPDHLDEPLFFGVGVMIIEIQSHETT